MLEHYPFHNWHRTNSVISEMSAVPAFSIDYMMSTNGWYLRTVQQQDELFWSFLDCITMCVGSWWIRTYHVSRILAVQDDVGVFILTFWVPKKVYPYFGAYHYCISLIRSIGVTCASSHVAKSDPPTLWNSMESMDESSHSSRMNPL